MDSRFRGNDEEETPSRDNRGDDGEFVFNA
jgi:hypothetical protein